MTPTCPCPSCGADIEPDLGRGETFGEAPRPPRPRDLVICRVCLSLALVMRDGRLMRLDPRELEFFTTTPIAARVRAIQRQLLLERLIN